jgi:hypothetical protein
MGIGCERESADDLFEPGALASDDSRGVRVCDDADRRVFVSVIESGYERRDELDSEACGVCDQRVECGNAPDSSSSGSTSETAIGYGRRGIGRSGA